MLAKGLLMILNEIALTTELSSVYKIRAHRDKTGIIKADLN